jgi:hypothetical protein
MRFAVESAAWRSEHPQLCAPKIHGELLNLGFVVAEQSVGRYLRRLGHRGDPRQKWLAFLHNHRQVLVAFDFCTVPALTFKLLHCFFVIEMVVERFCTSTRLHTRPQQTMALWFSVK